MGGVCGLRIVLTQNFFGGCIVHTCVGAFFLVFFPTPMRSSFCQTLFVCLSVCMSVC